MSRPVKRIAIVGRDAALWLTALALRRSLSGLGVRIETIEAPSLLRPVDVYAGGPHLGGLHHMLGLTDEDVLAACAGVESGAQRFAGWSKGSHAFMHAYDSLGASINQIEFVNYWTKARAAGLRAAIDDFSMGAAAAKVGRHLVQNEAVESFSQAGVGYNFHAQAYVAFLRGKAIEMGVRPTPEAFRSVEVSGDNVEAVVVAGGRRVQADLYIDASGEAAVLLDRLGASEFESWAGWFPCDRTLAASGPRLTPLPAFNQVTAFAGGWVAQYPLQNRTAVVGFYRSDQLGDIDALTAMSRITGMRLEGATAAAYAPGARARAWVGNCVAIGGAAISLEPLDATLLQAIHIGLTHLISLLPVDADDMAEREAFNHEMSLHLANLRDFTLTHYRLNRRFDEPMWDRAREITAPADLAQKIELFGARGGLAMRDGEAFDEGSWTACFIGHGLIPRSWNPLVDQLSDAEQIEHFQKILRFIASEVEYMPSLEAHLEFNAAPPGRGLF